MSGIKQDIRQFADQLKALDGQSVFVLTASALLLIIHEGIGGHAAFRTIFEGVVAPEKMTFWGWGWWSLMQFVLGLLVPLACMVFFFKRGPKEMGLGLGDWRLAGLALAVYLPAVAVGTWFFSDVPAMLAYYPRYRLAALDWNLFWATQGFALLYFIGYEFFFRGFMLFGLLPKFGLYAIFIQTVPFAALHFTKPLVEGLTSVVGGIVLGFVVWRVRSFWVSVPLHMGQYFFLILWCVLRHRTGVRGVGWDALVALFGG